MAKVAGIVAFRSNNVPRSVSMKLIVSHPRIQSFEEHRGSFPNEYHTGDPKRGKCYLPKFCMEHESISCVTYHH